ncbi:MAG TPA: cysteine desulfurase family protein [Candidatus Paceibacterota bacterium]
MRKRLFLDYAAGRDNPNAIYGGGREARAKLESARAKIAKVLSVATDEIIFTPWGTEANMLASKFDGHIITTVIEHSSLLIALKERKNVTYLKPDPEGFVTAKQVEAALKPNTKLVSVMYANNEIGTIQPIKEISRMLRNRLPILAPSEPREAGQSTRSWQPVPSRPLFHSDCVQAPGLLPINIQSLGLDMASFSAPKFGGPAGAAFVYIRRGTPVGNLRDACPVPLALEMADALEYAEKNREREVARLNKLRDYFIAKLITWLPDLQVNGSLENRLANNVNVVLPIESELAVLELDVAGIAASAGAACSTGECEDGSHVIIALGKSNKEASQSVRFSLGRDTKKSDLDFVVKKIIAIINKHTNIWQTK